MIRKSVLCLWRADKPSRRWDGFASWDGQFTLNVWESQLLIARYYVCLGLYVERISSKSSTSCLTWICTSPFLVPNEADSGLDKNRSVCMNGSVTMQISCELSYPTFLHQGAILWSLVVIVERIALDFAFFWSHTATLFFLHHSCIIRSLPHQDDFCNIGIHLPSFR